VADLLNSLSPSALMALTLLAKVTLVLLAGGAIAGLLQRVSAGFRHLVWSAAIVASVALPLVALVAPWRLDVGVLPAAAGPLHPLELPAQPTAGQTVQTTGAAQAPSRLASRVPTEPAGPPSTLGAASPSPGWSLRERLLAIWLIGVALVAARLALGSFLVARVVRSAIPLDSPEWRRPLVDVADRLALPWLPGLFLSDRLPMPFACGLFRTAIVLPAEARDWTERRRQAVLCHELAHLRRRDLVINVLAQCALAVYWFHPLMWVAVRRLRIESERACDDLVLGTGTRASEYADHLLEIVRAVPRSAVPVAVLPFAERGEFEGRVLAILERKVRRDPASRRGAVTVVSLALLLVAPLALAAPVRRTSPPVESWPAQLIVPNPGRAAAQPSPVTRQDGARAVPVRHPAEIVADSAVPAMRASEGKRLQPEAADTGDARIVVRSLIEALADTVASVRENAAYSLGRLRAELAAASLGRIVERDQSAKVREMTAWALGNIRNAAGAAPLSAAVQRDTSAQVRATAVWALAQLDAPAGLPALGAALRDRSTEVRSRAAWAIGSIRPEVAPGSLIEATADTSAAVRMRAAWALGQIRDPSAVAALSKLVQDPAADVREAALWALGNMEGAAAEAALVRALQASDPAMRAQAARALGGAHGRPWPWPWPWPR
jgi:HEAT repeat protein/beta-lactamase regulating signal transducer with metallopeptidase domain